MAGRGWHRESRRHSLARKGIRTVVDDNRRLAVNRYVARGHTYLTGSDIEKIVHDFVGEGKVEYGDFSILKTWVNDHTLAIDVYKKGEAYDGDSIEDWLVLMLPDGNGKYRIMDYQLVKTDIEEDKVRELYRKRSGDIEPRKAYSLGGKTFTARDKMHEMYLGLLDAYNGIGTMLGQDRPKNPNWIDVSVEYLDDNTMEIKHDLYKIFKDGKIRYEGTKVIGKAR